MSLSLSSLPTQGNNQGLLTRGTGHRSVNSVPAKGIPKMTFRSFLGLGTGAILAMATGCTGNKEKLPPKIASVLDKNGQFRPVEELYKLMDNLLINLSHETDAKPHLQEHIPDLQSEIGEFLNAKTLKDKDESLEFLDELLLKHRDFIDHLGLHAIYFAIKAKQAGLTSLKEESLAAVLNSETISNEYHELLSAVRMFSESFDKAITRSKFSSYDPIQNRLDLLGLGAMDIKSLNHLNRILHQRLKQSSEGEQPLPEIKPPTEAPRKKPPSPIPDGQLV